MDEPRGVRAERERLQRAAYGRGATDADRAALAAFERRVAGTAPPPAVEIPGPATGGAGRPSVTGADAARPGAASSSSSTSGREPPPQPAAASVEPEGSASAQRSRGLPMRTVVAAALAGVLVGGAAVAALDALRPSSALDAFVAPPAQAPLDSAGAAFSLFVGELDAEIALPISGPLLLVEAERWHAYGFLFADPGAGGGQSVCLAVVPPRPSRDAASGSSCASRTEFERGGLQLSLEGQGGAVEAAWGADGSATLEEG